MKSDKMDGMASGSRELICDFVDYLLPELTPYETSLYLYLLRNSLFRNGTPAFRVGKRTMADGYGTGSKGAKTNYQHMTDVIKRLEAKTCLIVGDTTREGTLYTVVLPRDIPAVREKISKTQTRGIVEDFFTDPQKRLSIFERDGWICQYCGEKVNRENATLDHYFPQVKGGTHAEANLRTCCLVCNGGKSGKEFNEAAAAILKSIQERRGRSHR